MSNTYSPCYTSGESIPYVAGWGEDGALEAIQQVAQLIDTIALRIEEAISPTPMS